MDAVVRRVAVHAPRSRRSQLLWPVLVAMLASGCAARHGGAVIGAGAAPAGTGGTISGTVRTSGADLAGRKVTAINEATGQRFDISTSTTGGYTVQVPAGRYRLEVELRQGETLQTRPAPLQVNVGDLDDAQNFVVAVGG